MSTAIAIKKELEGCSNALSEVVFESPSQESFFKPVDTNKLSGLFEQYELEKINITTLCQFMEQNSNAALYRLISANTPDLSLIHI